MCIRDSSRSFYGKLLPEGHSREFFGFFDIFGKFSAVVGPALFSFIAQATGIVNMGILGVMGMFVIGGVIFWFLVPQDIQKVR